MLLKILFTHDDLDGAGCRIVFELAHKTLYKGLHYKVVNCSNNNLDDIVKEYLREGGYIDNHTQVCFADICPKGETLELLQKYTSDIKIWDHHESAFPIQQLLPSATIIPKNGFGVMESGTSIMYKYYMNEAAAGKLPNGALAFGTQNDNATGNKNSVELLSKFVDTVRSYDTYEWKSTKNLLAKKLQILFFMLGMEEFCDSYIERIADPTSNNTELITSADLRFVDAKLNAEQRVIDKVTVDDVIEIDIAGHKTAFMMNPVPANISEVAYQFLEKNPQFKIFASFSMSKGGEFSFRTQDPEINVSTIAIGFGGGGHPKASGAPLPEYINHLLRDALMCHLAGCTFRSETWWEE